VLAVPLTAVLGAAGWAYAIQIGGNFHAVEEARLYRSAQLSGDALDHAIQKYGIRSIINLRGGSIRDAWYADEQRRSAEFGVLHFDLPLSAEEEPTAAQMTQLISLLETAPQPILVHCKSGADRSGLAAALFEYLVMRKGEAEAAGQLSFYFGHFPWLGSPTSAMDVAFQKVVAAAQPDESTFAMEPAYADR
jgi:protein tyrosine/serine phosphatase